MARIKRVPKKSTSLTSTENVVHNISRTYKSLHNLQRQSKITGGIKKPHPWKPSLGVLLDIRRYQRTASLLIPKLSFQRIVRSLTDSNFKGIKFQTQALHALQEACEDFIVSVFADTNLCALHGKRVTILPKDMQLALRIRGRKGFLPEPVQEE